MKFSWKALLLSPLPIPMIYAAAFELSSPGKNSLGGFLILSVIGGIVSYASVLFLLLPSLFIISRLTLLTAKLCALIGIALGAFAYFPVVWMMYRSSGPDSGPPEMTFLAYLRQQGFGMEFWAFLIASLVTTMLYWFLASRSDRKVFQAGALRISEPR